MPGPSTLAHGFADVLEAISMCLKVEVVILARCEVYVVACMEEAAALEMWREVGAKLRRGAIARESIYGDQSMRLC